MKLTLRINQNPESEEAQILSLIKHKETKERGYGLLIKKYSQRVYWQVRRMVYDHDDANDLTQDIFIKVFENIENFNNSSKLSTWIYRIAYNHTLNFIKSKNRKISDASCSFEQKVLSKLASDSLFEGDRVEHLLQQAILSLPPKQRDVFQMRYYDELSFAQISQITKTTQGGLKASYHIAAKKIEEFVKANCNEV